jgi:salicylate hydroxylase
MSIHEVGKSSVLIAGAGIGGLAMALSLLRRGIDCDVFEQASELREVGAGLWVSMNGVRVLKDLGLTEQVEQNCIAAERRSIRLWNTGDRWPLYNRNSDAARNQPYLLLRAHLLKILVDGVRELKPSAIHLNARVVGFGQDDERVQAKLADGSEVEGRALIGADGAHSKVRLGLIGNMESQYTKAIAWRGLVPVDRLAPHQREPEVATWIGPTAHVTAYPVRWQNTVMMTFSGQVDHDDWLLESWSESGSVEECLKDFEGWHPDIVDLVKNVDTLNKWGLFVRPSLATWSKGRVTLLGDACHSMLPYLGQGVNMALEDASVLARCLDENPNDVAAVFEAYQGLRLDRTSKVVKSAAGMLPVFHNKALCKPETAGDYIKAQWSSEATAARYDWIYRYDATTIPLHSADEHNWSEQ